MCAEKRTIDSTRAGDITVLLLAVWLLYMNVILIAALVCSLGGRITCSFGWDPFGQVSITAPMSRSEE